MKFSFKDVEKEKAQQQEKQDANKLNLLIIILIILFSVLTFFSFLDSSNSKPNDNNSLNPTNPNHSNPNPNLPVACTMDAKMCPDGSYVGRSGPNCEFTPCPELSSAQKYCNSFSVPACPSECVVCPPCLACSSISCQTKEFCNSIGFDENWFNSVSSEN
jgi:hypothetical protein